MVPAQYLNHGSLRIPQGITPQQVFPGVRGLLKKTLALANGSTIESGTHVIIQPLNKDKTDQIQRFKLTRFTRDETESELPEAQRKVITHESHHVSLEKPAEYLTFDEQYLPTTMPLFADGSPKLQDIVQGRIPDCFLLASILSILNKDKGASYIRSMMRDNLDGTVTVRLFNPKTQAPVFIQVEKSILVLGDNTLSNHPYLWVHLLEKAVSCVPEFFDKNDASTSTVLNFGQIDKAMAVLTGCNSQSIDIEHDSDFCWDIPNYFANEIEQAQAIANLLHQTDLDAPTLDEATKEVLQNSINETFSAAIEAKSKQLRKVFASHTTQQIKQKMLPLLNFYLTHPEDWQSSYHQQQKPAEQLLALIDKFSDDEDNIGVIETLKHCHQYYHQAIEGDDKLRRDNDTPFSGIYSPEEIALFQQIQRHLAQGDIVAMGTNRGFTAEQGPGLRARHAYAITHALEVPLPISRDSEEIIQAKMIRIRNPWNRVGAIYLPDEDNPRRLKRVECNEAGEFEIELKDFIQYTRHVEIGLNLEQLTQAAAAKELLHEELVELINTPASIESEDALDERLVNYQVMLDRLPGYMINLRSLLNPVLNNSLNDIIGLDETDTNTKVQQIKYLVLSNLDYFSDLLQSSNVDFITRILFYTSLDELSELQFNQLKQLTLTEYSSQNPVWRAFSQNHQALTNLKYKIACTRDNLTASIQLTQQLIKAYNELINNLVDIRSINQHQLQSLLLVGLLIEEQTNYIVQANDFLSDWQVMKFNQDVNETLSALTFIHRNQDQLVQRCDDAQTLLQQCRDNMPKSKFDDGSIDSLIAMQTQNIQQQLLSLQQRVIPNSDTPQSGNRLSQFISRCLNSIRQWFKSIGKSNPQGYERVEARRSNSLEKISFFAQPMATPTDKPPADTITP